VRLAQVFSNLLNNAVKYTDPGGRISIAARREDAARCHRADTGIGIAPRRCRSVFDMFVQADARDSRAQSGLGIGLTLVRSLVEMHGGSVPRAARARPRQRVRGAPAARGRTRRASGDAAALPPEAPGLPRVLVVDDNRDAADSLAACCRCSAPRVRVTHDGAGRARCARRLSVRRRCSSTSACPAWTATRPRARCACAKDGSDLKIIALTGWGQKQRPAPDRGAGFQPASGQAGGRHLPCRRLLASLV
jgi:hypothetical protein